LLRDRRDPRDVHLFGARYRQRPAVLEARPDILPQPSDLSSACAAKPAGANLPLCAAAERVSIPRSIGGGGTPGRAVCRSRHKTAPLPTARRCQGVASERPARPGAGAPELRRWATGPDRRRRCRPACPQCPREIFTGLCGDRPAASGSPLLRPDRLLHRAFARRGEPRPVRYSPTRSAADGAGCGAKGPSPRDSRWCTRISSLRSTTTARSSI
jgi:hypothetical protein